MEIYNIGADLVALGQSSLHCMEDLPSFIGSRGCSDINFLSNKWSCSIFCEQEIA